MNPYCPIGLGYGYCVPQVTFGLQYFSNIWYLPLFRFLSIYGMNFFVQEQHCFFPDLICGVEGNGKRGTFGDILDGDGDGDGLDADLENGPGTDFDCESKVRQNPGTGTIQ